MGGSSAMGIYDAMNSSVTGMNAQSNYLTNIGQNISNSSTTGYKQADTEFSTLVDQAAVGQTSAGGVSTTTRLDVAAQGTLQSTTSSTDLAISGNGFFVVSNSVDPTTGNSTGQNYLTRAGSFVPDKNGNLVNSAGNYLMGYAYTNGSLPAMASNSLTGMTAVNVASAGLSATPTTSGTFTANLPSTDIGPDAAYAGILTAAAAAGVASGGAVGSLAYNNAFEAVIAADVAAPPAGAQAAVITAADAAGAVAGGVNGAGTAAYNAAFTTKALASSQIDPTNSATYNEKTSIVMYDSLGNSQTVNLYFQNNGAQAGPPQTYQWTVAAYDSSGAPVSLLSPIGAAATATLTFNASGVLTSPASLSIHVPGTQTSPPVDYMNLNIGGMTQLAGKYAVSTSTVNGNAASSVSSVTIGTDGTLSYQLANGSTVSAYKIPLASVASPDNMLAESGNVYTPNLLSGQATVGTAGTGQLGTIKSSNLEESTVDVATQLTNMIVAQRNYQANSKMFSTGAQCMDTLINMQA